MRDRQTCIGCGKKSPETETNYTLISAQFGWRLTRYRSPDGTIVIEWRCPSCWREYKKAKGIDSGPLSQTVPAAEPGTSPRAKTAPAAPAPVPAAAGATNRPPVPRPSPGGRSDSRPPTGRPPRAR